MVSLVATRNMLLFSGALAAGAAAFWIALGRDDGTPMRLPVLPKLHAPTPSVAKATPAAPTYVPPPLSPVTPTAAPAKPAPATVQAIAKLVEASRKRLDKTLSAPSSDCAAVPAPARKRLRKAVTLWMDTRTPGEKDAPDSLEGVGGIAIGCADPD